MSTGKARTLATVLAVLTSLITFSTGRAAGQVTQAGGWTTGLTHSVGAGSNRMLVFFAGHENGKADTTLAAPVRDITGVNWGGQPLAQAAEAVVCTKSAANEWFCGRNEIWYLNEAGISAAAGNTFSVFYADADTLEFDASFAAVTLANVDQASPLRATGANATTSVNPLLTSSAMGVSAGDFVVVGGFAGNAGSYNAYGSYTKSTDQQSAPVVSSTMTTSFKAIAATGSEQPGVNFTGSINRQLINAAVFKVAVPTTTLATGTDPANASLAPGGAATMADAFTLRTSSGTESITAMTVTLAAGTAIGLSLVEITNNAGTVVYGTIAPASDTPTINLTTGITATTTTTQYKIRVTPKSHAAMPAPVGATYSVTARISSWTGPNSHTGSDTGGTTVTIDNLSPGNVTAGTATVGNTQVSLTWTNPADADLGPIVVLRRASAAVASTPTEGATYTVGNTVGSSTVACVVTAPAASCTDTGLTNGTAYHYAVFARDTNGNYATGVVPAGSPATPFAPPVLELSKNVSPTGTVPPGSDLAYGISLTNTGGSAATSVIIVDSLDTRVDYKLGSEVFMPGTSGLSELVAWSNDGGATYTYTPVSGAGGAPAGYDRTVTHVRWTFTGDLSHTAPANQLRVGLTVRIR